MSGFSRLLFVLALMACTALVWAQGTQLPFLHPLFMDHMVLQREAIVPVWGWTTPGASVTVSLDGKKLATGIAGPDGRWSATLAPMPAGGPYTLMIEGPQAVTLKDVLIGDVWICSGQSNMEFSMRGTLNAEAEIAVADHAQIRCIKIDKKTPIAPALLATGVWQECTPQNARNFTAVGYFFARKLHQELQIPIGIISTNWGGTPAESWTSYDALKAFPEFAPKLQEIDAANVDLPAYAAAFEKRLADWWQTSDPGTANGLAWSKPDVDTSDWKTIALPASFESVLGNFDGLVWYRKTVELPEAWLGKDLTLTLAPIDDLDITWFNGVQVGATNSSGALRVYKVPASAVRVGKNAIAIRAMDFGGNGGMIGKPEQVKLQIAGDATTPAIPLAGDWAYQAPIDFHKNPMPVRLDSTQYTPTTLYNGMIAPLIPFAIKGATWYQGESNSGKPMQYYQLLPAMITDWRTHWGQGDFPFYIVQLANYMKVVDQPAESNWAIIRDAQLRTAQTLPNCGMSVTIDIGDGNDIHPKNKQDVGLRLALIALAQTYGRQIEYSGPLYHAMKKEGKTIRLSFTHLGGGLVAKGDKLTGFAVCGPDGKYVWADAVIEGDTVVVSSPQIADPVAVRYAWADNPICNLYNQAGLPASPFQTGK